MRKFAYLLLLFTLPSSLLAGPEDAVVRLPSAGGSGTIIATGEGWTLVLTCAHCFEGKLRSVPVALDMPHHAPGAPKKVGITVLAVGRTQDVDLALLKVNTGPVPYVLPVAPVGYKPQGKCASIGFDEMKFPVKNRPAQIVGYSGNITYTDFLPFHGRSGGALANGGYLIGVVSAYESSPGHDARRAYANGTHENTPGKRGMYVSLPAIHRFLASAGVMKADPNILPPVPYLGTPSPFVQPNGGQKWGQPDNCPIPQGFGPQRH